MFFIYTFYLGTIMVKASLTYRLYIPSHNSLSSYNHTNLIVLYHTNLIVLYFDYNTFQKIIILFSSLFCCTIRFFIIGFLIHALLITLYCNCFCIYWICIWTYKLFSSSFDLIIHILRQFWTLVTIPTLSVTLSIGAQIEAVSVNILLSIL